MFIWQGKNCVHHSTVQHSVIRGNIGQYNMYPSRSLIMYNFHVTYWSTICIRL